MAFEIVDYLVVKPLARHRVQPQRGLVENRQFRARGQADYQAQRGNHAAGELARLFARVQLEGFQQGLRIVLIPIGIEHPAQLERFAHTQVAWVRRLFPHHAQPLLHRGVLIACAAKHQSLPLRGEQQPANHIEQRGFACAVAAQQAVNLSRFQGHVQIVQRLEFAISMAEPLKLQCRLH